MPEQEEGTNQAAELPAAPEESAAAQKESSKPQAKSLLELDQTVLHVNVKTPHGSIIRLENINSADTVLSIQQLISENPQTCHYTCYFLQLINEDGSPTKLNDFVEIENYAYLKDGSKLVMVLDRYDIRKARLHVRRLREVLVQPPILHPAANEAEEASFTSKGGQNESDSSNNQSEASVSYTNSKSKSNVQQKQKEIQDKLPALEIPVPLTLSAFHPAPSLSSPSETSAVRNVNPSAGQPAPLPECLKSICFSGWNPPPSQRRLKGDLCYLQVTTLDDLTFHVTATETGFFVNSTSHNLFDPTPAHTPHQSHSLLELLRQASSSFKKKYILLLSTALENSRTSASPYDQTCIVNGVPDPSSKQWNVAAVDAKQGHNFNANRAEDDLLSSFGMDERGVVRDWNEEYQCCKELPQTTMQERVLRARVLNKVGHEFVEAATTAAQAIVDGLIPVINPMDPERAFVYVYNNIFFSMAVDGREAYKDTGGDATAFAAANHDLQGVMTFDRANIKGLHTLLTVIVDYKGKRVVAQSIIPGILQSEAASQLVYGSVDNGHSVGCDEQFHSLMCEAGEKLGVAEREVQPLGLTEEERAKRDEEQAGLGSLQRVELHTGPVKICGPLECKGILGSDGRRYVLDLLRFTPRDANYVENDKNEGGQDVGKVDEGEGEQAQDAGYSCLLRPELLKFFAMCRQSRAARLRHKLREEKSKEKLQEKEEKDKSGTEAEKGEGRESDSGSADAKKEKKEERETANTEGGNEASGGYGNKVQQTAPTVSLTDLEAEIRELETPLRLNPNVFMKYGACTDVDLAAADEKLAREAASHLKEVMLVSVIHDVRRGSISVIDGEALTDTLHRCGINMRYLGALANLATTVEAAHGLPKFFRQVCETEMVARAAKHVLGKLLSPPSASENDSGMVAGDAATGSGVKPKFVEMDEDEVALYGRPQVGGAKCANSSTLRDVTCFLNALLGSSSKSEKDDQNDGKGDGAGDDNGAAVGGSPAHSGQRKATGGKKSKKKKGGSRGGNSSGKKGTVCGGVGSWESTEFIANPQIPIIPSGDAATRVLPCITYEVLWRVLVKEVKTRFRYDLDIWAPDLGDSLSSGGSNSIDSTKPAVCQPKLQLLRRVCKRCGIRIVSRDYDLDSRDVSAPFVEEDVVDLVPVVKHCLQRNPLDDAHKLLDSGRLHLAASNLGVAYELTQEAALLLYQVSSSVNLDLITACNTLATIFYHSGDLQGAIRQQQQAMSLIYQYHGMDHPETAQAHCTFAVFMHTSGQTPIAVTHMWRCIYLLQLAAGPVHNQIAQVYHKLGVMYQDVGQISKAIVCYREALRKCDADSMQAVSILHAIAMAYSQAGAYQEALAHEKKCYNFYKSMFGENEAHTLESAEYVNQFVQAAVEARKKQAEAIQQAQEAHAVTSPKNQSNPESPTSKKKKAKKKSRNKKQRNQDEE